MVKEQVTPCTKEEMNALIEESIEDPFYHMLFVIAKTTGRRLGEFYGVEDKEVIGTKIVGRKIEYDEQGNPIPLVRRRNIYQRTNRWRYGVKVKDIDFERATMKIWVLKRRQMIQDETILSPEAVRLIKYYVVKNRLKEENYLFREVSYRAIQYRVVACAKRAGIKHKVCFHNFRHYFITELKRRGWTNDMIMKLTGHKNPAVLIIYDHIVAEDIREKAMEAIKDL